MYSYLDTNTRVKKTFVSMLAACHVMYILSDCIARKVSPWLQTCIACSAGLPLSPLIYVTVAEVLME